MSASPARALLALLLLSPVAAYAGNCSTAPSGFGNAWEGRYKSWCRGCGGTVTGSGPRVGCSPGSNWGGGSGGGGGGSVGGGGSTADFAGQMSQILFDAAARTGAAAKRSRALGQAGAAQVNRAAKNASDAVGIGQQDRARRAANEATRKSLNLQNELQGLPSTQLRPDFTIPPDTSGAVRIFGDKPILMGGDPFQECALPPSKRRWDLDCLRIAQVHTDGYPAQWGAARGLGSRWAGLLDEPKPPGKIAAAMAKLSEYVYSGTVGKLTAQGEEILKSFGPTGEAAARALKARSILLPFTKNKLTSIGGMMTASVCTLASVDRDCLEAVYKSSASGKKALDKLQDDTHGFLKDEFGIKDPPGWFKF